MAGIDAGGRVPVGKGDAPGVGGLSDGLKVQPAPAPGAQAAIVAAAIPAAPMAPRRRKPRLSRVA
jgi:hypothetical protein